MAVHKLIIAEKPSVAEAIAHTVGARDKVYAKESKNFCYEGNGYYVANAALRDLPQLMPAEQPVSLSVQRNVHTELRFFVRLKEY